MRGCYSHVRNFETRDTTDCAIVIKEITCGAFAALTKELARCYIDMLFGKQPATMLGWQLQLSSLNRRTPLRQAQQVVDARRHRRPAPPAGLSERAKAAAQSSRTSQSERVYCNCIRPNQGVSAICAYTLSAYVGFADRFCFRATTRLQQMNCWQRLE